MFGLSVPEVAKMIDAALISIGGAVKESKQKVESVTAEIAVFKQSVQQQQQLILRVVESVERTADALRAIESTRAVQAEAQRKLLEAGLQNIMKALYEQQANQLQMISFLQELSKNFMSAVTVEESAPALDEALVAGAAAKKKRKKA